MISNLFQNSAIPVMQRVAEFTETRQELLASNIANFDTPGYRVRDLSLEKFQSNLKDAIHRRDELGSNLSSSQGNYGDPLKDADPSARDITYHDKSDVSLETQVAEIAKNQMLHDVAITIMRNQFQLLQAAISERA